MARRKTSDMNEAINIRESEMVATAQDKGHSDQRFVQPTRPWTHEQETQEMLRDCGRPVIRACVECGENAPETGLICDECREQNGLL